jgi:hypothetical protein
MPICGRHVEAARPKSRSGRLPVLRRGHRGDGRRGGGGNRIAGGRGQCVDPRHVLPPLVLRQVPEFGRERLGDRGYRIGPGGGLTPIGRGPGGRGGSGRRLGRRSGLRRRFRRGSRVGVRLRPGRGGGGLDAGIGLAHHPLRVGNRGVDGGIAFVAGTGAGFLFQPPAVAFARAVEAVGVAPQAERQQHGHVLIHRETEGTQRRDVEGDDFGYGEQAEAVGDAVFVHRLRRRGVGEADVALGGPEEHRRQQGEDEVDHVG